jgi:hypothetical protein
VSVLDRIPAWATTGVGSLPHDDAPAAAAHAIEAYTLPFCPQLPQLDGDMIAEWRGERRPLVAWDALLAALAARPPAARVVKLQVAGLVTLARALGAEEEELAPRLAAHAAARVAALADHGLDAVLVVDEPALTATADPRVWDPLRAAAPAWGLHLCCPVPWPLVERAAPDLLSFDLTLGLDDDGADTIGRLVAGGTRIAWGVLDAHRPEGDADAPALLEDALVRTGVPGDRSLLTPTCGSGLATVAREVALADGLRAVSRRAADPAGRPGPRRW